jgi:putative transcriptional regulator
LEVEELPVYEGVHGHLSLLPFKNMTPLKTIRNARALSIHLVAAAVNTTAGNLSRIENGKQKASPELAERLAKYFGYAVTEIQILYPERFKAAV